MENMEEKKHKHDNQEEDCPLCQTTEEAMDKLSSEDSNSNKGLKAKNREPSKKLWVALIALVIISGSWAVYASLSSSLQSSAKDNNLAQTQPEITAPKKDALSQDSSLAADFSAYDTVGNKFTLSDFKGDKPVLLVFWATWCGYCAKELPDLKIFTQENQAKLKVLVIASGEDKDVIKDYIKEKDVNFTMLLDEKRDIWNLYKVRGTPAHFLVDIDGEVIIVRPGLASMSDLKTMLTMLK